MHFLKSSTLLLFSACLAQVIAGPGGQHGQGNGIQAFGNQRDQADTNQGQGGPNAQNRNQSEEDCDEDDQGNGQGQADGQNNGNGRSAQGQAQGQSQDLEDNQDDSNGNGNGNNGNRGGDAQGNAQGDDQAQGQNPTVTMTVTTQIAAATAQPLTVMTVCPYPSTHLFAPLLTDPRSQSQPHAHRVQLKERAIQTQFLPPSSQHQQTPVLVTFQQSASS